MARLRALTHERLNEALGVLAQFQADALGHLIPMARTSNLNPNQGIRRAGDIVQVGLTENEIEDVYERVEDLLEEVDQGKLELF